MISIQNISKRFDKTLALNTISFEANHSDCYGLLGKNGAGKTTLLNILVGNLLPSSGSIQYFNQLFEAQGTTPIKYDIGFCIDESHLIEEFSAWEFLNFIAHIYNVPTSAIKERIVTLFTYLFDNQSDIHKKN